MAQYQILGYQRSAEQLMIAYPLTRAQADSMGMTYGMIAVATAEADSRPKLHSDKVHCVIERCGSEHITL